MSILRANSLGHAGWKLPIITNNTQTNCAI